MADIVLEISPSFDRIAKGFRTASEGLNEGLQRFVEEFAFMAESYSKQITPVDTGRLRASISTEMIGSNGLSARVGTHNVHYAAFVHEGTKRMKARPFMKLGAEFVVRKLGGDKISVRLDKELRKSLAKI